MRFHPNFCNEWKRSSTPNVLLQCGHQYFWKLCLTALLLMLDRPKSKSCKRTDSLAALCFDVRWHVGQTEDAGKAITLSVAHINLLWVFISGCAFLDPSR